MNKLDGLEPLFPDETGQQMQKRLGEAAKLMRGATFAEINEFHHRIKIMTYAPTAQMIAEEKQYRAERDLPFMERRALALQRGEIE